LTKQIIIDILNNEMNALDIIEINDKLGLKTSEELKQLTNLLDELIEENIVYQTKKDRYILYKNCPNFKVGKLALNKKGFGFVCLVNEDDIYIGKDNLNGAIHNDLVLCEIIKGGLEVEGRILKILKRDLENMVGEVFFDDSKVYLKLEDEKLDLLIEITKETSKPLVLGHKVLVKVRKQITNKKYLADVIKIIGHKNDPGVDILTIAYKYGIREEFSRDVENELKNIPNEVRNEDLVGRRDLTNDLIFTIDGDDTKDIDDAISLEFDGEIYKLGVHIADVSHYVKEGTALGNAAMERGTSSYLADTVIPMIPHQLSNGICSLNEKVLRLAVSCEMNIDKNGKVVSYDIFPSYIKSKKKMTYKKINDIIERNIVDSEYEPYKETILKLKELADILRKDKVKRGYIDFDLDEAKVVQDESGKAIDIIKRTRESGELIIEDFMIIANETVATHIYNMDLPFIYRTHAEPKEEKITDFINMVSILGYKLHGKTKDLNPKSMQNLLEQLGGKKEFKILSNMLLRSMSKAAYTKDNFGHFGLASRNYTHFTSPIRRFPDLIVHRLLRTYIFNNDLSMETIKYYDTNLPSMAEHSSEREVAAVNAERDVMDMKMAEYMESHVGEEFEGVIDTVTNFGFFVQLENLIEGLVHVNSLKGDFYTYIPEILSLIGRSTKKTYRLGDNVKVRVIAASKETSTIDFEIIEEKK